MEASELASIDQSHIWSDRFDECPDSRSRCTADKGSILRAQVHRNKRVNVMLKARNRKGTQGKPHADRRDYTDTVMTIAVDECRSHSDNKIHIALPRI